ncbi:MAG: hypothetical protein KJO07_22240 [Deltaproteobacteria bacterium]|nr:hypothetical protein [Deltaproteobacteria bacterium]
MLAGLYISARDGGIEAEARGALACSASAGDIELHFEGALTAGREAGKSDAQAALQAFQGGGLAALEALEGFFQLAVIDRAQRRATVVCDPLGTRPVFVYRGNGVAAVAPNPAAFADWGLPMTLDRLGLYQSFRVNHGLAGRTLVEEVSRARPATVYVLDAQGGLTQHGPRIVRKDTDKSLDLDGVTDLIRSETAAVISGLLTHPLLADRDIHLPLTSGMDSRHFLAELLDEGRPPSLIHHVQIKQEDFAPVKTIAADLGIPLNCPDVREIDWVGITRRWVTRSAGSAHFHENYRFAVADFEEPQVVGFDGCLADRFLGYFPGPVTPLGRRYSRAVLFGLFRDRRELHAATEAEYAGEEALWDGPEVFVRGGADAYNRGQRYTGATYPLFGDQALYFAPAAHGRILELYRRVPEEVAGGKRGRLQLFRKHFPELGKYPSNTGHSYLTEQWNQGKGKFATVGEYVSKAIEQRDIAPELEHAWMRQVPALVTMHKRVTQDSELARDGHLPGAFLRSLSPMQRVGAFLAWTLFTVITVEVGYRILCKGQSPDDVADWLTSS